MNPYAPDPRFGGRPNPRAVYEAQHGPLPVSPVAPQQPQSNILMDILSGISKPFRVGAEFVPVLGQMAGILTDPNKLGRTNWDYESLKQGGYKPTFVSEEEAKQIIEDPLQAGLKSAAGVWSWAVPGGGNTLGQAVGRGALGGAMSGFGSSKSGEELQGAALGGLTGGAAGGAVYGVGKLANAIRAGKGITPGSFTPAEQKMASLTGSRPMDETLDVAEVILNRKPTWQGYQQLGQMADSLPPEQLGQLSSRINMYRSSLDDVAVKGLAESGIENQAKAVGLWDETIPKSQNIKNFLDTRFAFGGDVGVTPGQFLEKGAAATERLGNIKQAGLEQIQANAPIGRRDITNLGASIMDDINMSAQPTLVSSKATDNVLTALDNLGDNPSAKSLDTLAQKWRGMVNYGSPDAIVRNQSVVYDTAANKLVDALKSKSGAYAMGKSGLSTVLGATGNKGVQRAAQQVGAQGVGSAGLTGLRIPAPVQSISRGAQGLTGRALEGLGGGIGEGASGLVSAMKVAPGFQSGLTGPIAAQAGLAAMTPREVYAAQRAPQPQYGAPMQSPFAAMQQGGGGLSSTEALMLADQMTAGNPKRSISDILAMAKFLQGNTSAAKPEKVTKDMANARSGLREVETMQRLLMEDPNVIAGSYLPFGLGSTSAQVWNTSRNNLADAIGRLRSGGVIGEEEEVTFRSLVPGVTDTPETRQYKLGVLSSLLSDVAQVATPEETMQQGVGYDPYYGASEYNPYNY